MSEIFFACVISLGFFVSLSRFTYYMPTHLPIDIAMLPSVIWNSESYRIYSIVRTRDSLEFFLSMLSLATFAGIFSAALLETLLPTRSNQISLKELIASSLIMFVVTLWICVPSLYLLNVGDFFSAILGGILASLILTTIVIFLKGVGSLDKPYPTILYGGLIAGSLWLITTYSVTSSVPPPPPLESGMPYDITGYNVDVPQFINIISFVLDFVGIITALLHMAQKDKS